MPIYVVTETKEILIEAEFTAENAVKAVIAYKQSMRNKDPNVSIARTVEDGQTVAEPKGEENT